MPLLMKYINRTARLSILYRSEKLKKYDLKGIHHSYILNICNNPGVSQESLAQMIFVNKSNVARQIAFLEKKGFIYRQQSETDRRQLLVYPTEKAYSVYPVVVALLKDWNAELLEDFSEDEKEVLVVAMQKIMNKAKQIVDDMETGES